MNPLLCVVGKGISLLQIDFAVLLGSIKVWGQFSRQTHSTRRGSHVRTSKAQAAHAPRFCHSRTAALGLGARFYGVLTGDRHGGLSLFGGIGLGRFAAECVNDL